MQSIRPYSVAGILAGALAVSPSLSAQSVFATQVFSSNTNGGAGGGIFNPNNALGAPAGSTGVHSLGIGGDLTLGFALPITNGPGADFLVGENPFRSSSSFWMTFAEMMFVEVSSDGVNFARFPNYYFGAPVQPGPFSFVPVGIFSGLAGQTPVLATNPTVDPQDVVDAGGDAFDLADLAAHPLVQQNLLNLAAVSHMRLVDVQSGVSLDSSGAPIFDPGSGSADVDAVTVIHQQGQVANGNPRIDLTVAVDGTMMLRVEDPDGWQDLNPASLRAALFGLPVDAGGLLGGFQVQLADPLGFTLVQPAPLPPELQFTIAFSIKDVAGNRSGQSRTRPAF
jgi:hypothetical protein